ncbi:glycosyltransferase family A protein [Bacillus wiedmannii]|uniref:glycosyltransferase family A protein n=1 Tax=Bacillus wiedmannii TaxID=1890302 RepID=UPI000BF14921|nr:glycosyltransferase family A protein [Bacillus wiedmannii]PEM24435.1 hypothetical protein CN617_24725 [Bacillus wiedmannii]
MNLQNDINYIDFKKVEGGFLRYINGKSEFIRVEVFEAEEECNKYDISVVMTNYNRKDDVISALESILKTKRNLINLEIIIVDDGSNDDSVAALMPYVNNQKIKLVSLLKNTGSQALPKNIGTFIAKGKYISYIDSDDEIFDINSYETCYFEMENAGEKYVMGHSNIIFQIECSDETFEKGMEWVLTLEDYLPQTTEFDDRSRFYKIRKNREYTLLDLMTYGYYDGLKLIRKKDWEKVGGSVEWLGSCCDFGLILKLLRYGNVLHINANCYKYRITGENDSFYTPEQAELDYQLHRVFVLNELKIRNLDFNYINQNQDFIGRYKFKREEIKGK